MATSSIVTTSSTNVIDLGNVTVIVPKEYPVLNPELIPNAKCVWVGALRHADEDLPQRAIWLEDKSFEDGVRPDMDDVLEAYFAEADATDEQKASFARWDEFCNSAIDGDDLNLANKLKGIKCNTLGLWPIIPGSVAEEYYYAGLDDDLGGDDVA